MFRSTYKFLVERFKEIAYVTYSFDLLVCLFRGLVSQRGIHPRSANRPKTFYRWGGVYPDRGFTRRGSLAG